MHEEGHVKDVNYALDVADGRVHFSQMDCDLAARAKNEALTLLAAAVRRLREESNLHSDAANAAELRIVELRAERDQLKAALDGLKARLEALPGWWRQLGCLEHDACADELEEALRGETT